MTWTQEQKDDVIAAYIAAEPTAETSGDIVKDLAEEFEQSPNGVRAILSKAGVYVTISKSPAKAGTAKATTPRVSKVDSQEALNAAIEAIGGTVDSDITSKLTGKAAVYFTTLLNSML